MRGRFGAIAMLAALSYWLHAGPAVAASLVGQVQVTERDRRVADAGEAVVWFMPERRPQPPAPVVHRIMTRDRRFSPRVSVVPVGSTVWFPNGDPIRHNVFSISSGNRFDLGLYGTGPGRSETFRTPGVVRVFCNVHRAMAAYVVVVDTPHHAQVDASGRFVLEGVPEGRGTLHVWHPRTDPWSGPIEVPGTAPLVVECKVTLPTVPPHLNKFGRPYPERSDDDYR